MSGCLFFDGSVCCRRNARLAMSDYQFGDTVVVGDTSGEHDLCVIFIHGLGDNGKMWADQWDQLSACASQPRSLFSSDRKYLFTNFWDFIVFLSSNFHTFWIVFQEIATVSRVCTSLSHTRVYNVFYFAVRFNEGQVQFWDCTVAHTILCISFSRAWFFL